MDPRFQDVMPHPATRRQEGHLPYESEWSGCLSLDMKLAEKKEAICADSELLALERRLAYGTIVGNQVVQLPREPLDFSDPRCSAYATASLGCVGLTIAIAVTIRVTAGSIIHRCCWIKSLTG